jgi:hypothetical protein
MHEERIFAIEGKIINDSTNNFNKIHPRKYVMQALNPYRKS